TVKKEKNKEKQGKENVVKMGEGMGRRIEEDEGEGEIEGCRKGREREKGGGELGVEVKEMRGERKEGREGDVG
ncbi:hypothetical protein, partial [Bacillus thuringiensis]|uniref:hypothetical protein n=1 Tax=Bacillus thuringiensis TaxID=1428 RepID=UPI001642402B